MKKILIIVFAILLFISCTGGVNYFISIKKGDIRKTYTKELKEYCDRKGIKDNDKVKLIIIKDM